MSAIINFPLWKAAAIGQSGFALTANSVAAQVRVLFGPPYRGVAATMFGMTWARAAIFYGSDVGKDREFGPEHPIVAVTLTNLGNAHRELGDARRAASEGDKKISPFSSFIRLFSFKSDLKTREK